MRMHKTTCGDNSKDSRNYSQSVKRKDFVGCGRESGDLGYL